MASFHLKRRGIVDSGDASPTCGTILRATISISFNNIHAATPTLEIKLDAPVFLFNDEAKASLTRAQRINNTFTSIRPRIRLALTLHIHPVSISSIAFARQSSLPDHLALPYHRLAGHPTLSLCFTLSAPPILVVPNIPGPLIPSTHEDLDVLKVFQNIAGAASTTSGLALTLYLPGTSLTDELANSLCANVPGAFEGLPEAPLQLQLDTLFGGLGARQVPLDEVAILVDPTTPTASPNSPPGYESSEHSTETAPPLYKPDTSEARFSEPETIRKRKRSRPVTPVDAAAGPSTTPDNADHLLHSLHHQVAAAHRAIGRLELLHTNLGKREAACLEREAALDEQLALADEKLAELTEASTEEYSENIRQEAYVNECIDELRQELRDEFGELLDEKLEVYGVDLVERYEVEDMVGTQVDAAIENLKARLAGGVRVLLPE